MSLSYSQFNSPQQKVTQLYDMTVTPYNPYASSSLLDACVDDGVDDHRIDYNYRYVAFGGSRSPLYASFFSNANIALMSRMITQRLTGVHPMGKRIVVPDSTILNVADSFWNSQPSDVQVLQEQVVMYIVDDVKNNLQTEANNRQLSAWVQLYSNDTGLTRFNDYKTKKKSLNQDYNWNY